MMAKKRMFGRSAFEMFKEAVVLIEFFLMVYLARQAEQEQSVQEECFRSGAVWCQKRMFRRSAFEMFRRVWKGETCIIFRADGLGARISFPWSV